jgi:hypothetical protein
MTSWADACRACDHPPSAVRVPSRCKFACSTPGGVIVGISDLVAVDLANLLNARRRHGVMRE